MLQTRSEYHMEQKTVSFTNPEGFTEEFVITVHDSGVCLNAYNTNGLNNVFIPDSVSGKPVTKLGDSLFFAHEEIEHIHFPDGLQRIGCGALANCRSLQEIVLPGSVTVIGSHAFSDCVSLRKVILPPDLETIETSLFAFSRFADGAEIALPENLKTIRSDAFYSTWLRSLVIPDSVTTIEHGAFRFGPEPVTKLPYDKGWFLGFPYGEKVCGEDGREGRISDISTFRNGCSITHISFDDRTVQAFFPFMDGKYSLCDEKSELYMKRMIKEERPGIREAYSMWLSMGGN